MTDLEKAIEWADAIRSRSMYHQVLSTDMHVVNLADAYRAEKKRADEAEEKLNRTSNDLLDALEVKEGNGPTALSMVIADRDRLKAENARLREFIDKLKALKRYRFTNEVGGEYGRPYIFADALEALTPSTPSHNGEVDPTHAHYGSLNEWPS